MHQRRGGFANALESAYRALCEFQIEGVATNIGFLQNLLSNDEIKSNRFHTRFIDDHIDSLINSIPHERHYVVKQGDTVAARRAGATIDAADPLAVLDYGRTEQRQTPTDAAADGSWVLSPMQGTIVEINVQESDEIPAGIVVRVMDSMKMEHEISAPFSGRIARVNVAVGDIVYERQPLISIDAMEITADLAGADEDVDLDAIRADLDQVMRRRRTTLDENRPEAVARRHAKQQRTARENVYDICDEGSFVEYGQLVLAAQRRRRSLEELIDKTSADGMVTGVGTINGHLFTEPHNRCVVMSYDYTVLAGTQGTQNHRKTDRMIGVAEQGRIPMVLFAEGGGGR